MPRVEIEYIKVSRDFKNDDSLGSVPMNIFIPNNKLSVPREIITVNSGCDIDKKMYRFDNKQPIIY